MSVVSFHRFTATERVFDLFHLSWPVLDDPGLIWELVPIPTAMRQKGALVPIKKIILFGDSKITKTEVNCFLQRHPHYTSSFSANIYLYSIVKKGFVSKGIFFLIILCYFPTQ